MLARLATLAVIGMLSATATAEGFMAIDRQTRSQMRPAEAVASDAAPAGQVAVATTPTTGAQGNAAMISRGSDGHYWAHATVDGHDVYFLVDTGASDVALTTDDARRLGIVPETLNYGYQVTTANGSARAAKVTLASVSVAGAEVDNVDAFVIENGLATSLLGMSYLGRLSQFEATPTSLTLRP